MFLNRYTEPSLNARDALLPPFTTRISVTVSDALERTQSIRDGNELIASTTIAVINTSSHRG